MATNITATLTPAGLLKVEGTKGNDNVAISRTVDNKQIEVLGGNTKLSFDASKVKSLQVDMKGGNDLLDITGLGNLTRDAVISTKDDQGQVDFRYKDQAGRQTHEWEEGGSHKKETTMANGDSVLEQSWPDGGKTSHFVTVINKGAATLVTAEDNGNGFVVTTTDPGHGQVKTTFDRYGGMWDGQARVPGVGPHRRPGPDCPGIPCCLCPGHSRPTIAVKGHRAWGSTASPAGPWRSRHRCWIPTLCC